MIVSYRDQKVGTLQPDGAGGFLFEYADEWLHGEHGYSISMSLPRGEAVDQRRADAFFSNLLPEGAGRERLCRQLGISPENRYGILREIGRDCAGALVIGDSTAPERNPHRQEIGTDELKRLLRDRPAIPVLEDGQPVRFSLAGSAGKWAIIHEAGRFYWPLGSAPSTHILKVYDPRFSHGSFNEACTGFVAGKLDRREQRSRAHRERAYWSLGAGNRDERVSHP